MTISALQLISHHVFLAYRGLRFGFDYGYAVLVCNMVFLLLLYLLGSKDLGFYVFRTLICIVGKP